MKRRLLKWVALCMAGGALVGVLAGCAWSVGSKEHVTNAPTRGQELMDLKKAKDQGVISQEEYDNKRKQILER